MSVESGGGEGWGYCAPPSEDRPPETVRIGLPVLREGLAVASGGQRRAGGGVPGDLDVGVELLASYGGGQLGGAGRGEGDRQRRPRASTAEGQGHGCGVQWQAERWYGACTRRGRRRRRRAKNSKMTKHPLLHTIAACLIGAETRRAPCMTATGEMGCILVGYDLLLAKI